jgi:tight adherence protein B
VVPVTAVLVGAAAAAIVLTLGGIAPPARRPMAPGTPSPLVAGATLRTAAARWVDRARPQLRRRQRDAQLPDALDRLASGLRAGEAIGPALCALAPTLAEPLRTDLEPVARALAGGAPVAAAVGGWAERPSASADVHLVVAALSLGAHAGGEVARAIDRIAATLRERRELQAEIHALATQARASAAVLAMAPIAFAGLVATIEPAAAAFLVTSPLGLLCLLAGLTLEGVGAAWMARITRSTS